MSPQSYSNAAAAARWAALLLFIAMLVLVSCIAEPAPESTAYEETVDSVISLAIVAAALIAVAVLLVGKGPRPPREGTT